MTTNDMLRNVYGINSNDHYVEKINKSVINAIPMYDNILKSIDRSIKNITNLYEDTQKIHSVFNTYGEIFERFNKNYYNAFQSLKFIDTVYKNIDYAKIFGSLMENITLTEEGLGYIHNEMGTEEEFEITEADIKEIEEDVINLTSHSNLNINNIEKCEEKWSKKDSFLHKIFMMFLDAVITTLVGMALMSGATTINNTNVYNECTNQSTVIYNIPEGSNVIILDGSKPYYYEVLFTDEDELVDVEGFVAKRNMRLIERELE